MVAAAIAGSSVLSAGIGLFGSKSAASTAANADTAGQQLESSQFDTTRNDLLPYNKVGQSAADQLQSLNTAGFTAGQPNYLQMAADAVPNANNMGDLTQTPGYQFTLGQGLESTQNAAAARGLGVSGAALKGAAAYATGLANSTYQQQFQDQQQKQTDYLNLNTGQQGNATNLYNRLAGTAQIGESAASQTGALGTTSAANQANLLSAAGNANAAGTTGATNAATSAISGGLSNYLTSQYIASQSNPQTSGYSSTGSGLNNSGNYASNSASGQPVYYGS